MRQATENASRHRPRLIQSKVDVILVSATALYDVREALAGVPTVFVIADDPVRAGLVASLARPAGHMTGLSSLNIELEGGRMVLAQGPVQVPDITAPGAYDSRLREGLLRSGARAVLAVPLLREDHLIGGLVVNRNSPGEFVPEVA
jgi:GAF domain-containing protein